MDATTIVFVTIAVALIFNITTAFKSMDIIVLGEGIPEVVRSLQVAPEMSQGERIAVLRSELERSVSFYNAAHLDKPIDLTVPVLVSGDLVDQESDKASLAGPRERPVRDMESPLTELEGFAPGKYATCIGLALKDVLLTEARGCGKLGGEFQRPAGDIPGEEAAAVRNHLGADYSGGCGPDRDGHLGDTLSEGGEQRSR